MPLATTDAARLALVARTLRLAPAIWQAVLADFRARLPAAAPDETADAEIARCLPVFAAAFRRRSPHEAELPPASSDGAACPACERGRVSPAIARAPGPLVFAACDSCGHGILLPGAATRVVTSPLSCYAEASYYAQRDEAGVGYDGYADEAPYREAKGRALIERLAAASAGTVRRLLEVGSSFGFTRAAAERAGITTAGVDLNPAAVGECRRRYGLDTFRGTLGDALAAPGSGVACGGWDAVLYQFVLEHVADPAAELAQAHAALAPRGWLVLLVPSMEAAEVAIFGGAYRSFRADHLHLMTRSSLRAMFGRTGFETVSIVSHCNIHLLRDVLSEAALARLYETGRGPDLFVLARKTA